MSNIFKALADPTRRAILLQVAEQPSSINSISQNFNISRPAVSKHIRILEDCDLISIHSDDADGRQRTCYAQLEALAEVNEYLVELHKFWDKRLENLGKFLDNSNK